MLQTKKSIIFFVLLFSIAISLVLPMIASADTPPTNAQNNSFICGILERFGFFNFTGGSIAKFGCSTVGIQGLAYVASVADWLKDEGYKVAIWILKVILTLLTGASKTLSIITGTFLETAISPNTINLRYTPGPANGGLQANDMVTNGWLICRDLANMMIVLGFVIIGIATILRIKEYEAGNLLFKLIVVAILVNFSPLICGMFIDFSNILMKFFLGTGDVGGITGIMGGLNDQVNYVLNIPLDDPSKIIGVAAGYIFGNTMAFLIFGLLAFLFLARYVMLWMLVIFSPIAFVCYVFKFARKYFEDWWSEFIKWCLVGIPASFTIYLANSMMAANPLNVPLSVGGNQTYWAGQLASFLLPGLILLVGFFITLKFSGAGAAIAIGAAMATGTAALGAVKGIGKAAANKTGVTRAATGVKDWASQHLENMGFLKAGSTASSIRSRIDDKDRVSRINNLSAEQKVQELLHPRWGNDAHYDRAAIVKSLGKDGQLGMIPASERQRIINNAISFGAKPEDLIEGMESTDIAGAINNNQYNAAARTKGLKKLIERGDLNQVTDANRQRAVNEAAHNGMGIGEFKKADYHWSDYDTARVAALGGDAPGRLAARAEQLESSIQGMNGFQRRNIDVADWRPELIVSPAMNAGVLRDLQTATPGHRSNFAGIGSTPRAPIIHQRFTAALDAAEAAAGGRNAPPGTPVNNNELNRINGIRAEITRLLQQP